MRRLLLIALSTAALAPSLHAQTAYLRTDFGSGIPADFVLADIDMLEPSIDMKNVGFAAGLPWIVMSDGATSNKCAVSTSWYRKAGRSDDWMITPAIEIGSDQAVMRWKSKAGDKDYRDGYSVYVSETASSPDEFKLLTPAYTVARERAEWTDHELPLSEFKGKSVRVAIVNNSEDCHTLYIDDIFVGIPAALEVRSLVGPIVDNEGYLRVTGMVRNISDHSIDGFSVRYRFGNDDFKEEFISGIVNPGKEKQFDFLSDRYISRDETLPYEFQILTGDDVSEASGNVSCYYRRIVAEEVTGTWCGYCVRGIVAMREMKEKYPDTFLGIAVHGSSPSWPDPMDFTDYTEYLFSSMNMSGYPHASVNRRQLQTGDPSNIEIYYSQLAATDLVAAVTLNVDRFDLDSRGVSVHSDVHFTRDVDEPDYGVAYVLIENDVCNPQSSSSENGSQSIYNGWEQNNYYAGGDVAMGGFENLPPTVPGPQMVYQDVARAFWGDGFDSLEGSLPIEHAEAFRTYSHEYDLTLPENMLDDDNSELAVLLINRKTGEIVNADVVSLRPYFSGVEDIQADETYVNVTVSDGKIRVVSATAVDSVSVYDAGGLLAARADGISSSEAEIDADGLHGLYIVAVHTGNGTTVRKLIL